MGALTSASSWNPEDDVLLKNAVEAGASLESLAKGAIQFSRRFTLRQIQERWHSLLYDPDISSEASARMMEFERSTSNLTLQSSKLESSKEGKITHKRKVESVRRLYCAMQKRICNNPLNQVDVDFLVAPAEVFYQNGNEELGHSDLLGVTTDSHFEFGNSDFDDLQHVFSQDVRNNIDGTCHESENGDVNNLEDHPNEQHNICEQIPQAVDHNLSSGVNCAAGGGLPTQNILADRIEMNPMSNGTDNNICPGLEQTNFFNSPISECDASFQHLQYSSPPPAMAVWRNMEGMPTMEMASDSQYRSESPQTGGAFGLTDDAMDITSGCDIVHSDTEFQNHIACDGLKTSASCPQFDLAALSDTLLNLSDDEMLLMDDDGKEFDKYGLNNLLLDSPSDLNGDQMLTVAEMDALLAPETDVHNLRCGSAEQLDQGGNETDTNKKQNPTFASDINPHVSELCQGFVFCTLNTEDLEVPNNDHVIYLSNSDLDPFSRQRLNEASCPALTVKDISHNHANETESLINREMKQFGEYAASQSRGHATGFNQTAGGHRTKLEPPRSNVNTNPRHPGTTSYDTLISKEVISEPASRKQACSSLPDLPVKASDGLENHFESHDLGIKQEGQVVLAINNVEVCAEIGTTDEMAPEPLEEPVLSEMEEELSDSDLDIPYTSDVESRILEMDLGPEDLDSHSTQEVAKYKSEDAKREIIRLEQSAHAFRKRAMASHGAFAYLYGRHSRHYIKKPEVLLGRETEDTSVDIDLGKEGRANKISRRQAIIKLDEKGEFHLRNLGKSSIYVDSKEVYPGQSLILDSNCLIQVRDIPYTFVKSQARVKRYLDDASRRMLAN